MTAETTTVYRVEDEVFAWLERVGPGEGLRLDGEEFVPEPEARFSGVADVEKYVDQVIAHLRKHRHGFDGREQLGLHVRPRKGGTRAHYEATTATIAIPDRRVGGGWALREHVVLHEIAHHLTGAGAGHNAHFRKTFLRLLTVTGHPTTAHLLDRQFAAAGLSGDVPETAADADEASLAKIAKLLRMAERTTNSHEAEAFLARAQELATRHSVDLAVARAHTGTTEQRQRPEHRTMRLGRPGQRGLNRFVQLMLAVGVINDLRFTISGDSTAVTGYGFASDLDVAEALWTSLVVQMVDEAGRWLARGEHKGEHLERWDPRRQRWERKPVSTITARLSFYDAYVDRIRERLEDAKEQVINERIAAEHSAGHASGPDRTPVSTSVALREKTKEVTDYFDGELKRLRITRSWRGGGFDPSNHSHSAGAAGRAAADRAHIGGQGPRGALPRGKR